MRCLAQWGVDDDELWWEGKVSVVHNTEKETLLDIVYDDGDVEYRKPLERVRRRARVQKAMESKRIQKSMESKHVELIEAEDKCNDDDEGSENAGAEQQRRRSLSLQQRAVLEANDRTALQNQEAQVRLHSMSSIAPPSSSMSSITPPPPGVFCIAPPLPAIFLS